MRIAKLAETGRKVDPFAPEPEPVQVTPAPFDEYAERFIREHVDRKSKAPWDATRIIRNEFVPVWVRNVRSITKSDVLAVLNGIVERGSPIAANRALARIRKIFNWLVDIDVLDRSPCYRVPTPSAERSRDRVLRDAELVAIWRAAETCGYPHAPITNLLILLGQRRSEVAGMPWSEIDLTSSLWSMPARSTKNSEAHLLPLPKLAVEIIQACPHFSNSTFVFPSAHGGDKHLTGFTVLKAKLDQRSGVENWIFHDCRRSMATHMPALGVDETIIERIQNHTLAAGARVSQVQKVYSRYKYIPEMLRALEQWAEHLVSVLAKGELPRQDLHLMTPSHGDK